MRTVLPDALQNSVRRTRNRFGIFAHGPTQTLLRNCLLGSMSQKRKTFIFLQYFYRWRNEQQCALRRY